METQALFIHGAGEDAFAEDGPMVNSLTELLANQVVITYEPMPDGATQPTQPGKKLLTH